MKKALKSILSITLCLIMLLGTISGTFMRFCDIIKIRFRCRTLKIGLF